MERNLYATIDQTMESYRQKLAYETLQARYEGLETELKQVQEKLQNNKMAVQEKELDLQTALLEANLKIRELQEQIMTPAQLVVARLRIQKEVEETAKIKQNKLQEAVMKHKAELLQLQQESENRKNEFDHEIRVMGEKTQQFYEQKICLMKKEKEHVVDHFLRLNQESGRACVGSWHRERDLLQVQMKVLKEEVQAARAESQASVHRAEQIRRQLTESHAIVSSLKEELQSVRLQLVASQTDGSIKSDQIGQLSRELHAAQEESASLRAQIERMKIRHEEERRDISAKWLHLDKEHREHTSSLQHHIQSLQNRVVTYKTALDDHLDDKEEFHKASQVMEELMAQQEEAHHDSRLQLEERLRATQLELQLVRKKTEQQTFLLERRRTQRTEDDLLLSISRVRKVMERKQEELVSAQAERKTVQQEAERLQAQNDVWQQKYSKLKDQLVKSAEAQMKRKAQTKEREKKLQQQILSLQDTVEKLEGHHDSRLYSVHQDQISEMFQKYDETKIQCRQLRSRYDTLERQHSELKEQHSNMQDQVKRFRTLLQGHGNVAPPTS